MAWQHAANSDDPVVTPVAMYAVGGLLKIGTTSRAPGSPIGTPSTATTRKQCPKAANNLGILRAQQGDVAGAQAAYQYAIDSKHPTAAPKAANNLGNLLAEQEDTDGAQAAYQQAIDSGDDDVAPLAALKLGTLLDQNGDIEGYPKPWLLPADGRFPELRRKLATHRTRR